MTENVCHAGFYRATKDAGIPHDEFSHGLHDICITRLSSQKRPFLRGDSGDADSLSSETWGWAAIAGGPSIHADALAHEICDRIAAGESLRAICRDDHMPGPGDYNHAP